MKLDWGLRPTLGAKAEGLVAPGLYHFTRLEAGAPVRFHLRVDPDGGGLLLANASEVAHLSPVGVLMAQAVLSGQSDTETLARVRAAFSGATEAEIADDLWRVHQLITELASPDANYPVTNFGGAEKDAGPRKLTAPYQADVVQGEVVELEPVLRALWDAGIPQVTFLAQRQMQPRGLVMLVERAEDLGMIAGIRSPASWLAEEVLRGAALAGLDYLVIPFCSCDADEHDSMVGTGDWEATLGAFSRCREWELCPVAQVPLADATAHQLDDIVECAVQGGVANFSVFAIACPDGDEVADAAGALPARALPQAATLMTEVSERLGVRFTWAPPVRFDRRRTLGEHILAGPRTSVEVSVRVEADGSVYPPRGPRRCAGNILRQPWSQIWESECFTRYRESVAAATQCPDCPGLELCRAGCPRDLGSWSDDTGGGE